MQKRRFTIGAITDTGNLKKQNQDNILVKVGDGSYGEFGLFIVADGMGGLAEGETASRIIVDWFAHWWDNDLSIMLNEDENIDMHWVDNQLVKLIESINRRIIDFGMSINQKVGSTLSALFIYGDTYFIKHIGDSRIYSMNDGVVKLTEDHSWVAQQVREGKMTSDEAKIHPNRNVLTRCLGVMESIELYECMGRIKPEDDFLVCSDGFHNYLDEEEIYSHIDLCKKEEGDIQECLAKLLQSVKQRGAHDNVSAVLVCQNHDEKTKEYSKGSIKESSLKLNEVIKRISGFGKR
jgi:serine/threonine protein phosphatase PrpC